MNLKAQIQARIQTASTFVHAGESYIATKDDETKKVAVHDIMINLRLDDDAAVTIIYSVDGGTRVHQRAMVFGDTFHGYTFTPNGKASVD